MLFKKRFNVEYIDHQFCHRVYVGEKSLGAYSALKYLPQGEWPRRMAVEFSEGLLIRV